MNKHLIISFFIIIGILVFPTFAHAVFVRSTSSFGGKVLSTTVPSVVCTGFGTGPVLLINNISSLGSAVYSGVSGGQQVITKTANVAGGIYGAIPFYTKINIIPSFGGGTTGFVSPTPKVGDWILGNADIIPDFSTCAIQAGPARIPFPVRDTSQYNTSGAHF